MNKYNIVVLFLFQCVYSCNGQAIPVPETLSHEEKQEFKRDLNSISFDTTFKVIHIFVALCDNKYQGIVPVPAKIGNGQDPNTNLYWGCGFGIRTYFKNSNE